MSQPERKLGTWPIFVIAVSAMTPLTVVAGALPLGYGSVGEKGIPVAYMLVAAVLGIFTVGLAAMARHVPNSGAFYAYASIGLSRPAGVGTAFVALLAYNAMQIGLYGAFGVAAHNALAIFGLEISWIVWALLGWAVIAVLGRLDIDLNARILTVLVCAEVLVVLVFDAVMLGNPAGGTVTFDTLNPALIASAGGVSLLVAAIAGMVGFEAPLVYAAEARDPRRTVARAIGLTLLVAAVLYGGTAWAMSVSAGPDQIVAVAGAHLNDLFFFLPEPYLPSVLVDLGRIFFATSLFAAMLAFHHTVARYGLTVAREGVLPRGLARTRDGVPVAASTAQSALALAALLIFAVATWNPTIDLFLFGTVSGGLGVLILMTIASIAVVRFFRRNRHGETTWRSAVAPWIAAVFLSIVLLLSVAFFSELLDSDNVLKIWSPTLLFLLALIGGIVWGRKLRQTHPEVYAVIGTGQPPLPPGETVPPAPTAHELRTGEPSGADRGVRAEAAATSGTDATARADAEAPGSGARAAVAGEPAEGAGLPASAPRGETHEETASGEDTGRAVPASVRPDVDATSQGEATDGGPADETAQTARRKDAAPDAEHAGRAAGERTGRSASAAGPAVVTGRPHVDGPSTPPAAGSDAAAPEPVSQVGGASEPAPMATAGNEDGSVAGSVATAGNESGSAVAGNEIGSAAGGNEIGSAAAGNESGTGAVPAATAGDEGASGTVPVAGSGTAGTPRPAPRKRAPRRRAPTEPGGSAAPGPAGGGTPVEGAAAGTPAPRRSPRRRSPGGTAGTGTSPAGTVSENGSADSPAGPEPAARAPRTGRTPSSSGGSPSGSRGTPRRTPRPRGPEAPDDSPAADGPESDR
ncbi:amino acid permease [Actinoplanes sp. NPDC049802]|uniref:amino acid permease n=1 Tax=Actinoplanes sp. NPDC049802 TaxID=3154742 RepID=UPI0033E03B54